MQVSEYLRLQSTPADGDEGPTYPGTRLGALSTSLLQELERFEQSHPRGEGLDLLEALAAAVRHRRPVLLQLQLGYRVIPMTVRPVEREVHTGLPMARLLEWRLAGLIVLSVEPEPAVAAAAAGASAGTAAEPVWIEPLGPWMWELALRGGREALLPEIAGPAAYRVTPGADLRSLALSGSLAAAVARLQRETSSLHEIATWPGFDRERAQRMLNGLYLQAALRVTRSHPAADDGPVA
jgi:hypothetical protein